MFSDGHHQSGKVARIPMVLAFFRWDVKWTSYNNFSRAQVKSNRQ